MNIHFHNLEKRPTARYISSTTVREEALQEGRLIGLYWSAGGQVVQEYLAKDLPGIDPLVLPLQVFHLEIDGQSLSDHWQWHSAGERESAASGLKEAVIELRHQIRPIAVKVVTRLDGTPFLTRHLEITNLGKHPAALSRVSPWSGLLWNTWDRIWHLPADASPFTLGHFDSHNEKGNEGNFVWEPLLRGTRRIGSNSGQSGFGNPYFFLRNDITGECAIGALAWSGEWEAEFYFDPTRDYENRPARGLNLCFRMGPVGPGPLRIIAPGETVVTPGVHLALLHVDQDEAVAHLHNHLRTSVIPPCPQKKLFPMGMRMVEETGDWILREIDLAAEMGLEAFMVDAGWYCKHMADWKKTRGDWQEGGSIAGGVGAAQERAHKHGLRFGLWMEPEAIDEETRLCHQHPNWRLASGERKMPVLNLAIPEAAQHFTEEMLRVIRENQLDFFKLDYNLRVYEGGRNEREGYLESETWRHYEILYAALARVRKEFPQLALENCASGGGRNDLGMLSHCHYASISDLTEFPRSIRIINGLTQFLPPEALCYYHNLVVTSHQAADLDTHLRVALFVQPIFMGFGAQDNDYQSEYFSKARSYIKLIKEFTGAILSARPRVYHHTPNIGIHAPADWCVLEYARPDRAAGYAGIFRLGGPGPKSTDSYLFRPRGTDPARRYQVTLHNANSTVELTGEELSQRGIYLPLPQINTSELILYQAKTD
jgi:alpha-galactosidase